MSELIKSIYLWTCDKEVLALNLIVYRDYSSERKQYKVLPKNIFTFFRNSFNCYYMGPIQDFIKYNR
jgi:hypothetical protein